MLQAYVPGSKGKGNPLACYIPLCSTLLLSPHLWPKGMRWLLNLSLWAPFMPWEREPTFIGDALSSLCLSVPVDDFSPLTVSPVRTPASQGLQRSRPSSLLTSWGKVLFLPVPRWKAGGLHQIAFGVSAQLCFVVIFIGLFPSHGEQRYLFFTWNPRYRFQSFAFSSLNLHPHKNEDLRNLTLLVHITCNWNHRAAIYITLLRNSSTASGNQVRGGAQDPH